MNRKRLISTFVLTLALISCIQVEKFLSTLPYYAESLEVQYEVRLGSSFAQFYRENLSKQFLFIPIGRFLTSDQKLDVYENGKKIVPSFVVDDCGAKWLNFSLKVITNDIEIQINRIQPEKIVDHFNDDGEINITKWISSTKFIDSDNSDIQELAHSLIQSEYTILENAYELYKFVEGVPYEDTKVPDLNASEVLNLGYGVCEDQARLFVALCRAVMIPARTITGFIAKDYNPIFSLHMWVEIRGEDGTWYSVCPTNGYFDFYDARFVDYAYSMEESLYKSPINSSSPILAILPVNLRTQVIPITYSLERIGISFCEFWIYLLGSWVIVDLILTQPILWIWAKNRYSRGK